MQETIKNVKQKILEYKDIIRDVEQVIKCYENIQPERKYSMSILVNGSGITKRFSESSVYAQENNLRVLLNKAGLEGFDNKDIHVEFSHATLGYFLGEMEGEYLELSGEDIRYKLPKSNKWNYLDKTVIIEVHRLPISTEDFNTTREKSEKQIIEKLTSSGLLDKIFSNGGK